MKNDGGAAFPLLTELSNQTGVTGAHMGYRATSVPGMSLRDYFAAMAMQGLTSGDYFDGPSPVGKSRPMAFAERAYEIADAMLKERSKP